MLNPETLPDNISVMLTRIMESDNPGTQRCHRKAAEAAANGNAWDEITWLAGAVSIEYPDLEATELGHVATELAIRASDQHADHGTRWSKPHGAYGRIPGRKNQL
jgi:hypothetical protein